MRATLLKDGTIKVAISLDAWNAGARVWRTYAGDLDKRWRVVGSGESIQVAIDLDHKTGGYLVATVRVSNVADGKLTRKLQ
jgi:hypothetical protein